MPNGLQVFFHLPNPHWEIVDRLPQYTSLYPGLVGFLLSCRRLVVRSWMVFIQMTHSHVALHTRYMKVGSTAMQPLTQGCVRSAPSEKLTVHPSISIRLEQVNTSPLTVWTRSKVFFCDFSIWKEKFNNWSNLNLKTNPIVLLYWIKTNFERCLSCDESYKKVGGMTNKNKHNMLENNLIKWDSNTNFKKNFAWFVISYKRF